MATTVHKRVYTAFALIGLVCLAAGLGYGQPARGAPAPADAIRTEDAPAEDAPVDGVPIPDPDEVAQRQNTARARFGFPDKPDLVNQAINEVDPYGQDNDNPLMFPATPEEVEVIQDRLGKMHAGAMYVQEHVIDRSDLGGIWYDFESGGVTHIALADVDPSAVLRPPPDEAKIQLHTVERTLDELMALDDAVLQQALKSDVVRFAEIDIDLPSNKVVIEVIVNGDSTIEAARELLDDIVSPDTADFVEGAEAGRVLFNTTYGGQTLTGWDAGVGNWLPT